MGFAFLVFVVPGFLAAVEAFVSSTRQLAGMLALLASIGLTGAAIWSLVKQAQTPIATFVAGMIVPLLTIVGLSLAALWAAQHNAAHSTDPLWRPGLEWAVVAALVFAAIAFLDVNEDVVDPFYRRRLALAFDLTSARLSDPAPPSVHRDVPDNTPLASPNAPARSKRSFVLRRMCRVLPSLRQV